MKRILSLVLSLIMLLACFPSAVSANGGKQLFFELSSNGESTIIVDAGEEFTVDFYVQNTTDDDVFGITVLENQIEYKHEFFEFVRADLESGPAYWAKDNECSWDRTIKWLEIMSSHYPQPAAYNNRQLVTKVTFKVKDDIAEGSSGVLSNKACIAAFGGADHTISTKDMKVFVGSIPTVTHTLTYINEGNVINESKDLTSGEKVKIYGAPPAAQDKKFAGWVDENGVLWEAGADYTVEGDMTFNAKWLSKYTLSFETNGGSAVSPLVRWEDQQIDVSEVTTTKSGFDFGGWYEDSELIKPVTTAFKLTADKTVYAKWIAKAPEMFTLTFNTNGGSEITAVTKAKDTVISLSEYVPTKSGYTFDGWYKDYALTQSVTSVTLNADTTVYAKWTKKESGGGGGGGGGGSVTKYTITLMSPDGTKLDSVEYKENTVVDLTKLTFAKEGYVLDGWYTDSALTNKVTSVKLTENTVLYANWIKSGNSAGNHPEILTKEHYAYIVGREGGKIEPGANITRAEVATIFFRLLTEDVRNENISRTNNFADVNEGNWYNTAVSTLAHLGIINGRTEDTFAPNAYITRAEFTTIAARFSDAKYQGEDLFSDIAGHWAKGYINTAASLGWVVGNNGIFRPNDKITRAEVMTLVNRVLNRVPESEADLHADMTRWVDNANTKTWYYLAVQEATNSHDYEFKADGVHERWTAIKANPDWTQFEK